MKTFGAAVYSLHGNEGTLIRYNLIRLAKAAVNV